MLTLKHIPVFTPPWSIGYEGHLGYELFRLSRIVFDNDSLVLVGVVHEDVSTSFIFIMWEDKQTICANTITKHALLYFFCCYVFKSCLISH